ncbi:MAG TPA: bifunctional polysaccharide deacetylase/glycosyltransferase family 2 protein [Acidimicrobiales bacterium]|nr:bifunctional polysaccharide deacetylase/glycosyltransferase family 2 protein [Acidimicrobiales bacterium]
MTRWIVLVALLAGLLVSLAIDGLLAPASGARAVGEPILPDGADLGPAVEVADGSVWSSPAMADVVGIALVDTGSSGPWSDAAGVLDRHGADATWFVSGRTALDHPGRLATVRASGDELGVTGFSGRDLASLAPWRTRVELSTAQATLAARQGVTTALLLMPSTPTGDTLDRAAVELARTAAGQGYTLVVGTAPAAAGPGDVAVLPLDAGAPAQLEALLTRLDAEGLRAVRVSEAAGMDPASVNRRAGLWAQLHAAGFVLAVQAAGAVSAVVDRLFMPLAVLMTGRAVVAIVLALAHARRRPPERPWLGPVSVVVPAYNESAGIAATLHSLVASDWRYGLEVIVVDDGSTDGTADLVAALRLPGVRLVRQPNQGKPAALNTGLALARGDVVVMIDGDTVVEPDTIAGLVAPFADPRVGASSGNAKVANRGSLLGRWQHIEYVMGFNLDRRLLATLGAITTVPGAAGAFRAAALRDVEGVSEDTIAEDTDLTIAIHRAGWRVVYVPDAVAWTEAPSSVGDLWRQRYRWCYGTLQAVWKHRRAVVEGRSIGLIGLPYALMFQVVVALAGPVVDVAALYGLATSRAADVAMAWLGFSAAQLLLAAFAMRLDGESLRPLWAVPLQQVVYRQLMYLVVIQSVAAALAGTRLRWHKLRRLGLAGGPATAAASPSFPARGAGDASRLAVGARTRYKRPTDF